MLFLCLHYMLACPADVAADLVYKNVAPRNVSSVSRSLEIHASLLGMEEVAGIVLHPLLFSLNKLMGPT